MYRIAYLSKLFINGTEFSSFTFPLFGWHNPPKTRSNDVKSHDLGGQLDY